MSANDMLKWMKFNLNMGKTETGRQLLDKKRFAQMHKVTTPVNYRYDLYRPVFPVDDITIGYGYGWSIQEYRGKILNPYLTNGFSHHYHLGESTISFRDVKSNFYSLSHFAVQTE